MRYREVTVCPFCGDESRAWDVGIAVPGGARANRREREVFGRNEILYSRCACDGSFQNPMPTDESIAEFYQGEYRTLTQQDDPKHGSGLRAKRIFPYFPEKCGDLLDVGCFTGELMQLAGANGWRTVGVEPNDAARECAREFGPVYGRVDEVRGDFDLIAAVHVLEHVADPVYLLSRLAILMRPSGQMLVVVPKDSYRPPHLLAMAEPQVRMLFSRADLAITALETVETKTDTKADIIVRAH